MKRCFIDNLENFLHGTCLKMAKILVVKVRIRVIMVTLLSFLMAGIFVS